MSDKAQANLFKLLAGVLLLIVAVCLSPGTAAAHPLPKGSSVKVGLHKVVCTVSGKWCDRPPRPGPQEPCDASRAPYTVIIHDPILDADVEWECRTDGKWYRLRIVPGFHLIVAARELVLDWMRACPQLACRKVLREHRYWLGYRPARG